MDVILCGYVATWHSVPMWIGDMWYLGPRQIVLQQYSSMSKQRWAGSVAIIEPVIRNEWNAGNDFSSKRANDTDVYMYTKCLVVTPVFIKWYQKKESFFSGAGIGFAM